MSIFTRSLCVRVVYAFIVVLFAWVAWALIEGSVPPWEQNTGLKIPLGRDLLAYAALVFGFTASSQLLLRWHSYPDLQIHIHNNGRPVRLGYQGELPLGASEKYLERDRWLRQHAFLYIAVIHRQWFWWVEALMPRPKVEGAQTRFCYMNLGTGQALFNGEWIWGRWNHNPEPVEGGQLSVRTMMANRRLPLMFPCPRDRKAPEYEEYTVAFVVKREGDLSAYHFNDDSYRWSSNGWRNPDWQIPIGTYLVEVRVTGYGTTELRTARFKLHNDGPSLGDLLLERVPK